MNVRKSLSLHPQTVQAAARNEAPVYKRARRAPRQRNSSVRTTNVLDGVDDQIVSWVRSHEIDTRRIKVVSPTQIIVHNPKD